MSESEAKKNRKERDKDVKKEEGGRKEGMARRQVVKKVGKKDVEKDREDGNTGYNARKGSVDKEDWRLDEQQGSQERIQRMNRHKNVRREGRKRGRERSSYSRYVTSSPAACAALTYSIPSARVKANSNFESAPASYQ